MLKFISNGSFTHPIVNVDESSSLVFLLSSSSILIQIRTKQNKTEQNRMERKEEWKDERPLKFESLKLFNNQETQNKTFSSNDLA